MSMMILGELCNFGAYAFVAAIVVVRLLASQHHCPTFLLIALWGVDANGRSVCRHLRRSFVDIPQGEAVAIRLDRLRTVYSWQYHYSGQLYAPSPPEACISSDTTPRALSSMHQNSNRPTLSRNSRISFSPQAFLPMVVSSLPPRWSLLSSSRPSTGRATCCGTIHRLNTRD